MLFISNMVANALYFTLSKRGSLVIYMLYEMRIDAELTTGDHVYCYSAILIQKTEIIDAVHCHILQMGDSECRVYIRLSVS